MLIEELSSAASAFVAAGAAIGSHAATAATLLGDIVAKHNAFLATAAATPKPADAAAVGALYTPVNDAIVQVDAVGRAASRSALDLHVRAVNDSTQVFYWIAETKPVPFIEELIGTAQFTGNKILTGAKGKPDQEQQQAYVKALTAVLRALQAFVKAEHTTGLRWNFGGGGAGASNAAAAASSASAGVIASCDALDAAVAALLAATATVDASPEVTACASAVQACFAAHRSILDTAASSPNPSDRSPLLAPLANALGAVEAVLDKNKRSKQFQLLEALQQLTGLLPWVSLAEKPVPFLKENAEILDFSLNKVMRAGGAVREWSLLLCKVSGELVAYVTENHKTGLYFQGAAGKADHADPSANASGASSEERLDGNFTGLVALGQAVDSGLGDTCGKLAALVVAVSDFLQAAKGTPKPANVGAAIPQAVQQALGAVLAVCDANTRHKTLFLHYEAISQVATLFNWVCVEKPLPFIEENFGSFDFFCNKIFTASKGQEAPTVWTRALKAAAASIGPFVKEHYRTGVVWGAAAPAGPARPPITGGPPIRAGGPPPPPPPPPPPAGGAKKPAAADIPEGDMSRLFSQIASQGLDITKTLRKVSDSEKLYKQTNREVRTVNDADLLQKKKKSQHQWAPPKGIARCELQGDKKWFVEYQCAADPDTTSPSPAIVELENPQRHHVVVINRCNSVFIKIAAKVNSIQIIESTRVQLDLLDTVGPVEVTGCENVEILVRGVVPNVITGKVKGITVHLQGSKDTELVTSCTTNANITYGIVDEEGDKDTVEVAVPEQFMSQVVGRNKVKTTVVEHSSA